MTKSELRDRIKAAEILIKKPKGNDEFHIDVVAVGSMEAIACSIGKALVDLANTSEEMYKAVYCLCKGMVAEIEDPEGTPDSEEVFEDEADLKEQEEYEDLEHRTWEAYDTRTYAEMMEDSEGGLISED